MSCGQDKFITLSCGDQIALSFEGKGEVAQGSQGIGMLSTEVSADGF
jgi:hypothetical protein